MGLLKTGGLLIECQNNVSVCQKDINKWLLNAGWLLNRGGCLSRFDWTTLTPLYQSIIVSLGGKKQLKNLHFIEIVHFQEVC